MLNPYQRRLCTPVPSLRQRGFSLLAMILFSIVSIGLASYFLMAKSFNASNDDSVDRARAATIISQAEAIQGGFNLLLSKGITPAQVRLDATPEVGIYDEHGGSTVPQGVDRSAIINGATSSGVWLYRGRHLKNPGVGSGGPSYALMLVGLGQRTCSAINSILHGQNSLPIIPLSAGLIRSPTASAANPNDFSADANLSGNAAVKGWHKGCFLTTDNYSTFFYVLLPQ